MQVKPATDRLTIIFTTRSASKAAATLRNLQVRLKVRYADDIHRFTLSPESVDLTDLRSVRALAQKLLASDTPCIDALVLNAGIGGWSDLNWSLAVRTILYDLRRATTWPTFKLSYVGTLTKPQLPPIHGQHVDEPPLAEVFCANVFGHYMLAHWLTPLLWSCDSARPARILWMGSLGGKPEDFRIDDFQGLKAESPYEHTKWITDHMALTAQNERATERYVKSFLDPTTSTLAPDQDRPRNERPSIRVIHPGIVHTAIIDLPWILMQGYALVIFLARWLGSPWATATSYAAAISAVSLALAPHKQLMEMEEDEGGKAVKWGSAVNRWGTARVETTEVVGWGLNGSGKPYSATWWGGPAWWGGGYVGRNHGATDATKEDVENFVVQSAQVWKKLEDLRVDWEHRLEDYDKKAGHQNGSAG
jgi:3-keto steroid reductase